MWFITIMLFILLIVAVGVIKNQEEKIKELELKCQMAEGIIELISVIKVQSAKQENDNDKMS